MRIIALLAVLCAFGGAALSITKYDTKSLAAVLASALVSYTNDTRDERGLQTLTTSPELEVAAQMKANDMAEKGYFAHISPDGTTPWYWIQEAGYSYAHAGENLAVDFVRSKDVTNAWMNSPSHRANMVSEKYTEIGIATARGTYNGQDTVFVVQMFGTPLSATSTQLAAPATPSLPSALALRTASAFRVLQINLLQLFL